MSRLDDAISGVAYILDTLIVQVIEEDSADADLYADDHQHPHCLTDPHAHPYAEAPSPQDRGRQCGGPAGSGGKHADRQALQSGQFTVQ